MSRTAKRTITIRNEGVDLLEAITIDFVGAGVNALDIGDEIAEIDVTGGGGSGSANIATEELTGTQDGDNITLDLTELTQTWAAIQFVSREGQIKQEGNLVSGWSRSGDIVTVYNADASEFFLVQYTYGSSPTTGNLLDEAGDNLLTEDGDNLIQE